MAINLEELRRQSRIVLGEEDIALLRPFGVARATREGEVLFDVGDAPYPLVVVLSGRTEIVDRSDSDVFVIKSSGPGEFDGELCLLTGQPAFAASIVREAGEGLVIPQTGVQAAIATMPAVSDLLVAAFAARRPRLMRAAAATVTRIGPENATSILRMQAFTMRNLIPSRWIDPADPAHPAAAAILDRCRVRDRAGVWVLVTMEPDGLVPAEELSGLRSTDGDDPAEGRADGYTRCGCAK